MIVSIYLHTCNVGGVRLPLPDPVTKQVRAASNAAALTEAEAQAVEELLRARGARGPDQFGFYQIETAGGPVEVQVGMQGLARCSQCAVTLRSLAPAVAEFLFELMRAGNLFLVLPFTMETPVVVSPEQQQLVMGHLPEGLMLGSPAELHRWLSERVAQQQRVRPNWFLDDDE
jgi:hypothetical protein